MQHIAIMNKKYGLIEKILNKSKTIESRWYSNRINPWNNIKKGEVVYFKNSGQKVTAKAIVDKVIQYSNLDNQIFKEIIEKYADKIQLTNREYNEYFKSKKYVILIFLNDPETILKPFNINKKGFGTGCAWMCIEDINMIKTP